MRKGQLVLGALLWAGAMTLLASTPQPAKAALACDNTDCHGTSNCSFLKGSGCYLTGGSCWVTDC